MGIVSILILLLTLKAQHASSGSFSSTYDMSQHDPFFSSFYQSHYDPSVKGAVLQASDSIKRKIEEMDEVDEDPFFTYKHDHISAIEAEPLPEVNDYSHRYRRQSPDFFDSYDKFFASSGFGQPGSGGGHVGGGHFGLHEGPQIQGHLWHGKKDKDKKKKKKIGKGKKDKKDHDEEPKEEGNLYSFDIDFNPTDEYERIRDISERQKEQLQQNPGNCKTIIQNGQVCQECTDPFTGDTSQTCNYADEYNPPKMSYARDSHYDSKTHRPNDEDFEHDPISFVHEPSEDHQNDGNKDSFEVNSGEIHDYNTESFESKDIAGKGHREENNDGGEDKTDDLLPYKHSIFYSQPTHEDLREFEYPHSIDQDFFSTNTQKSLPINHKAESTTKPNNSKSPLKEKTSYYNAKTSSGVNFHNKKQPKTHESIVATPIQPSVFQYNSDTRQDVDRALAEFKKRDWSNCKKVTNGDQTCYHCVDKLGINHNECMTVSESRPQHVRISFNAARNASYGNIVKGTTTTTTTPSSIKPKITHQELIVQASEINEEIIEKPVKTRTKKVVIVKRKKQPENSSKKPTEDDILEKKTYKRMVSYTGKEKPIIQFDFEINHSSTEAPTTTTVAPLKTPSK